MAGASWHMVTAWVDSPGLLQGRGQPAELNLVERRGFEPLTSAVRGREYDFEYGTGCEGPFDLFPRDGGHGETGAGNERLA